MFFFVCMCFFLPLVQVLKIQLDIKLCLTSTQIWHRGLSLLSSPESHGNEIADIVGPQWAELQKVSLD